MADWETRVVRSDGCRVAYDCRQGEGPEVVLLHGYGLDRTMWAPQLAALEGWTVLNLDIRGHGDSRPCADFSIPQAAEDLRAVLVKERCRAPVLVGLSMGGYVVQEYAWQFGGCAGYLVAGATPILLDCYSGWERAGLRASTPLLGVWPWMFGHPVQKKTRLWLKGLPLLEPTDIVDPECGCHEAGTWFMRGGKDRQKNRAKTFPGLAKAMAEQWGGICGG